MALHVNTDHVVAPTSVDHKVKKTQQNKFSAFFTKIFRGISKFFSSISTRITDAWKNRKVKNLTPQASELVDAAEQEGNKELNTEAAKPKKKVTFADPIATEIVESVDTALSDAEEETTASSSGESLTEEADVRPQATAPLNTANTEEAEVSPSSAVKNDTAVIEEVEEIERTPSASETAAVKKSDNANYGITIGKVIKVVVFTGILVAAGLSGAFNMSPSQTRFQPASQGMALSQGTFGPNMNLSNQKFDFGTSPPLGMTEVTSNLSSPYDNSSRLLELPDGDSFDYLTDLDSSLVPYTHDITELPEASTLSELPVPCIDGPAPLDALTVPGNTDVRFCEDALVPHTGLSELPVPCIDGPAPLDALTVPGNTEVAQTKASSVAQNSASTELVEGSTALVRSSKSEDCSIPKQVQEAVLGAPHQIALMTWDAISGIARVGWNTTTGIVQSAWDATCSIAGSTRDMVVGSKEVVQ